MTAVKQNGCFEICKNQTPEICLEAVKQDGLVLKYVKDRTIEICMKAIK